jgi:hypothetical protein
MRRFAFLLVAAGCSSPPPPSTDPVEAELMQRRKRAGIAGGLCMGDPVCMARADAERRHAELMLQQHREGKANRAVIEQAIATEPAPQPEPPRPTHWWCFSSPTADEGWCLPDEASCAEQLVASTERLTKYQASCTIQATAFCFFANHDPDPAKPLEPLCHPTAVLCATWRTGLESQGWRVSQSCIEGVP